MTSSPSKPEPRPQKTFVDHCVDAVDLVRNHPGVEHIWLNAFSCVNPTGVFAEQVGRTVIEKVMAQNHPDVLRKREVVLRINAS